MPKSEDNALTPEDETLLAELESKHGYPADESEDEVVDDPAAEDEAPAAEDLESDADAADDEEDEDDQGDEEPEALDLGEYTQGEYDKAVAALKRSGFEAADIESWSPRKVAAHGLRLDRDHAEKQSTWQRLQELQNTSQSSGSQEEPSGSQPPSGDPSVVTPAAIEKVFADILDDDAAKEVSASIKDLIDASTKPLKDALQATQMAQLQRDEAAAFDSLSKEFPDPRVPSASLLDSTEIRDLVMTKVAELHVPGGSKSLHDLIRQAARDVTYDAMLEGAQQKGKGKAERSSRRRKGTSSSVGLRSRKSESLSEDQRLDALLDAAEQKYQR